MPRGKTFPKLLLLCSSLLACLLPCTCYCKAKEKDGADVKGMFVFGSSLVDNGNNNFVQNSVAKADYSPYGIDFPLGPSGRFTNGKNVIDLLSDRLKLPALIPAFFDPSTNGSRIMHGIDYASGGSGILDKTGSFAGHVISMNQQIESFKTVTLPELEAQLGCGSRESLPHYLFVVGAGGNDYTLNYFLARTPISLQLFTANLTTALSSQLQTLYHLGGRKFVLMSVYPLGCSPMATAIRPIGNGCIRALNFAALLFNFHMKKLVDTIKPKMPGADLVYVNAYRIVQDIIQNPVSKGFSDASNACCEVVSRVEGGSGILCKRGGWACANRNDHVFFDGLHPTEAVNHVIANKAYASDDPDEVYPINVKQLAQI
ncbi:hypothetical protein L1049_025852 [Liquidambar formosana]|uniref:GDSL esterase/lipase n=1 Tax=Liquidambar formosana TaxID=63359 RepID=A0AAP0NEE8_LIQFO